MFFSNFHISDIYHKDIYVIPFYSVLQYKSNIWLCDMYIYFRFAKNHSFDIFGSEYIFN